MLGRGTARQAAGGKDRKTFGGDPPPPQNVNCPAGLSGGHRKIMQANLQGTSQSLYVGATGSRLGCGHNADRQQACWAHAWRQAALAGPKQVPPQLAAGGGSALTMAPRNNSIRLREQFTALARDRWRQQNDALAAETPKMNNPADGFVHLLCGPANKATPKSWLGQASNPISRLLVKRRGDPAATTPTSVVDFAQRSEDDRLARVAAATLLPAQMRVVDERLDRVADHQGPERQR